MEEEQKRQFLDPRYEESHDPFLLTDMRAAVERVEKAFLGGEKITVYADYDADAVTAAAVLLRFFEKIGYGDVDYYIPDRFTEGYGMNVEAMEVLKQRGTNLIITVDCGINAFDSVVKARELGIDVIITDHHQLTGGIPAAVAVVNPHRPDDVYPFKDLTGVGVAFKLVQALTSVIASGAKQSRGKIASSLASRNDITPGFEKWLLDLVAIGTVADCQSLLGENRIFVKWGMTVLGKSRWVGLRTLIAQAHVRIPVDTYQIGFVIAPRINAAGRLKSADTALELLLTDDSERAEKLADELDALNLERQRYTDRIVSEAREQILAMGNQKIYLAAGEGWHKGVVGLVAGKLSEEFYRPVLVLGKEGGEATGSARSIGSFNIIQAISQSREILTRYGGHPQAAGFSLREEHIEVFRQNLLLYAQDTLEETDLSPVLKYEAELLLPQINENLVDLIEKFEPFGVGNLKPRFRINNLFVKNATMIGQQGKHLRLSVEGQNGTIGCIGFNLGFWADKLREGERIDMICEPQYNEWNGRRSIQLRIVDLQLSSQ